MRKILVLSIWFPITVVTVFFSAKLLQEQTHAPEIIDIRPPLQETSLTQLPYRFYSSLPTVLGANIVNAFYIESQDIIPELIERYLAKHQSPMTPSAKELVQAARRNHIDPFFMIAIAQCESNLGKKMPYQDEGDRLACRNPFGWGIHSQGTICFETWEDGYEIVAKGLREKYYQQGLNTPEDIMHVYTPPALEKGGSWAKCINQFMDILQTLQQDFVAQS